MAEMADQMSKKKESTQSSRQEPQAAHETTEGHMKDLEQQLRESRQLVDTLNEHIKNVKVSTRVESM